MHRACWVAAVMLLFPTAARGDDHKADLYFGVAYAEGSNLWGLHQAFAFTLNGTGRFAHDFSIVGDVSQHFGSNDGSTATRVSYLTGPRWTIALRNPQHKLLPHVLIGTVHQNDNGVDTTDFAAAIGGGWEYVLHPPSSDQSSSGLGFRVNADYVVRKGDADNYPRVSVGVIYRFKKNP